MSGDPNAWMRRRAEDDRPGEHSLTGPALVRMSDVTPERVAWLWEARLPVGKLVVIDGDPSTGKSTLTLDLAARVSTGTAWPDGAPCAQGTVLLLSAEDGLADTIAPRLEAAGADRSHVLALEAVPLRDDDGTVSLAPPTLPRDIPHLRKIVTEHHVRLVILDVLMAYLAGKVDSHRDQDVRGVLAQLASLAEDTGCTIVLIRHLNKAGGSNALYRGGGSIGIVGAARSAFLVARDQDDNDRRLFAVTKSNLAGEAPTLAYRLVSTEHGCARVEWEAEPVEVTASQLLAPVLSDDERVERDDVCRFLLDFLTERGGSAAAADIRKAAQAEGLEWRRVQRARSRAGVISERTGFPATSVWSIRSLIDSRDSDDSCDSSHGVDVTDVEGSDDSTQTPVTTVTTVATGVTTGEAVSQLSGPHVEAVRSVRTSDTEGDERLPIGQTDGTDSPLGPPRCDVCKFPMDPTLAMAGEIAHPNCSGDVDA